jgi:cyclophilin family peptidyl-prolyl cis-trans isomerase
MPRRASARAAFVAALVVAAGLAGCLAREPFPASVPAPQAPAASRWPPLAESPTAILETAKGRIVLQLADQMAPVTVANFVALAARGFYDRTTFHRVAKGFVIQGGDPNSRNADASTWGYGGPGYTIPDEFHPWLRHDEAGTVSMAKGAPDSAGSQFFITLAPEPQLDDRQSVFARVVQGMDVVDAIAAEPNRGGVADGAPVDPVVVTRVTIQPAAAPPSNAPRAVSLAAAFPQRTTERGRATTFAVVVRNDGERADAFLLDATPPQGWTSAVDAHLVAVPAHTARVALVTLAPGAAARGDAAVDLVATSQNESGRFASLRLVARLGTLGGAATRADYVGMLADGRVYDTTDAAVASDPAFVKLAGSGFPPRLDDQPLPLPLNDSIRGFASLAAGARAGETQALRVAWPDGYDDAFDQANTALDHKELVLEARFS